MESVVKSWAKRVFRRLTEPVSTTRGNQLWVAYVVLVVLLFSTGDRSWICHYRHRDVVFIIFSLSLPVFVLGSGKPRR